MQKDLQNKMGGAVKWSSITEIAAKLVSPIINMILARLLVPEAFGVVATLTMVVSFAEIFTDAGFQKYIVQHEFADQEDLDQSTNVAFWTNLTLSILIWAGISCFATPIANMVGSPGSETAIIVMCLEIPMLAFSSIQMARYRREFDFKNLFVVRMAAALVPLVVTVPLAFILRSHWALVFGTLAKDVLNAVILTIKSRWKPKFQFSFAKLKEMISFSLWTVVENISIWLTNYVGTFVVGNVLSTHYLGLYKTTMSTINSYTSLVSSATTPVLFSGLSRCQDDEAQFREVFFKFQRMAGLLLFPLGFGIYTYREMATSILLGSQWAETADFLGLWALTNVLSIVFSHFNSEAFRSKGRPRLSVVTQVLHLMVLIPVLIWAAGQGYRTLTVSRSLIRLHLMLTSCIILRISAKIRILDILKNTWAPLAAAVIMAVAGTFLRTCMDSVIWELATVVMCVFVYGGVMLVLPAGRRQLAEIPLLRKLLRLKSK